MLRQLYKQRGPGVCTAVPPDAAVARFPDPPPGLLLWPARLSRLLVMMMVLEAVPDVDEGGRERRASYACRCLGEVRRELRRVGRRVGGQQEWLARGLTEVEVPGKGAEYRQGFPDVGTWVGAPVGLGVELRTAEEVVLDELEVGVGAEGLMVDVTLLGVRGDDQPRDAETVSVLVRRRGNHVVVEPAPVVP